MSWTFRRQRRQASVARHAPRRFPRGALPAAPAEASPPAIFAAMASSACSARAPSGPPACAMSGRPPPPLPPSASAPMRARSTALKRAGEIGGDADDEAGLALLADADNGDDARAQLLLGVVDQAAQILRRDAVHGAGEQLHAVRARGCECSAAPPPLPPPSASSRFASASSRSSLRRSSMTARQPLDHFVGRDLEQLGRLAHALVLRGEMRRAASPVSASMRRTPAATALSPTILNRPISPVRRDMRAAAELDRISVAGALAVGIDAHRRRRAPRRRISRRTAPARLRRWPRPASSDASRRPQFCRIMALTRSSTARISSCVIGFGCEKSKRSRSGATSEPFCATWSPSTWRSASCRRCVAE